jgi:hypothetical protein
MTFLAPWALAVGALAAAGAVLLHLVARQRPATYLLPTARFVPDRRTLVSRVSSRPRDLWLLLLRVLLILSAAAAFARPVLTVRRTPRARILLVDRSAAVADPAEVRARVQAMLSDGVPTRVLAFDSTVSLLGDGASALDSLRRSEARATSSIGSISAALVAARRLASVESARYDSVELALVSPVTAAELDMATDAVRAQWPGTLLLGRVAARADSGSGWSLGRALSSDDVLGPALVDVPVDPAAGTVRLVRGAPSAADSAFARAGGAIVRWDSIGARRALPNAVVMGDDVVIASFARDSLAAPGAVLARWADGTAAAVEETMGRGCLKSVAIGVPFAGDLPLRPAFQRVARGLVSACADARPVAGTLADSLVIARLAGTGAPATGAALGGDAERVTPLASWLIALALVCALLELWLRARSGERVSA